jgi:hypothetical protein
LPFPPAFPPGQDDAITPWQDKFNEVVQTGT